MMAQPRSILICPDEFHIRQVGRAGDGRCFFLTTPFVPAAGGDEGCEYIALYLFDEQGSRSEARINGLGPRATLDSEAADALYERQLDEIAPVRIEPIRVKPFEVTRFGVRFGLIPEVNEFAGGECWVHAKPGDYLAFRPPWDGRYDT
jgi:hypothetical protein